MTMQRSHISLDLIEALQMLKFSLNHGHGVNFSCGRKGKLQKELKEYLQNLGSDTS
jgi:hypothetical protein